MEEIASQFREELQEIVDRYKTRLSVPSIMHIAQDVFHKTLSSKYHTELHAKEMAEKYAKTNRHYVIAKPIKPGSEPNAFSGPNAICSQGPDGCCATYKGGWDKCKGCGMYHGDIKCTD